MIGFDADGAPEESAHTRFFCKRLKPSVKASMEQCGIELDSWDELIEQAIDGEAKAPAIRDPRGESSAFSERTQAQDPTPLRHSSRSGSLETSDKKYRKDEKKQRCQKQARKGYTLATSVSATSLADGPGNGTARNGGVRKDLSHITCFNCDDLRVKDQGRPTHSAPTQLTSELRLDEPCWMMCLKFSSRPPWRPSDAGHIDAPGLQKYPRRCGSTDGQWIGKTEGSRCLCVDYQGPSNLMTLDR